MTKKNNNVMSGKREKKINEFEKIMIEGKLNLDTVPFYDTKLMVHEFLTFLFETDTEEIEDFPVHYSYHITMIAKEEILIAFSKISAKYLKKLIEYAESKKLVLSIEDRLDIEPNGMYVRLITEMERDRQKILNKKDNYKPLYDATV